MNALVDAGPLIAYLAGDDPKHGLCVQALEEFPSELVIPQMVLAEVSYFINTRIKRAVGVEAAVETELALIADIEAQSFLVEPVNSIDWRRISELVRVYRSFPLGMTDASVIAAAERLQIPTIATLDARHFHAIKPRGIPHFDFLL